jgi:hypothetical protein
MTNNPTPEMDEDRRALLNYAEAGPFTIERRDGTVVVILEDVVLYDQLRVAVREPNAPTEGRPTG